MAAVAAPVRVMNFLRVSGFIVLSVLPRGKHQTFYAGQQAGSLLSTGW